MNLEKKLGQIEIYNVYIMLRLQLVLMYVGYTSSKQSKKYLPIYCE